MNWQFTYIISLSLYLAQKLFILINLVWLAFGFDSGLNNIVLVKRKFVFLIWMAGDEFKLYKGSIHNLPRGWAMMILKGGSLFFPTMI